MSISLPHVSNSVVGFLISQVNKINFPGGKATLNLDNVASEATQAVGSNVNE